MQLDQKNLERLLRLSDDQLRALLAKLLVDYGVDVSRVPLATMNIGALRDALRGILQTARGEDIARLLQTLGGGTQSGG